MSSARAAAAGMFLLAAAVFAQEQQAPDLPALVGLPLSEVFIKYGAPAEVFAARGAEPWQDDVVFYYAQHLYLFLYENRVWQARVDARYAGPFLGLSMGCSREQVLEVLGAPLREFSDSLVYQIEDRGYPVRLRLYFEGGALSDAYCFRGDL